ncbi:MAG TPA: DUF417 family protein [Chloroflexota bacterium]|nr:DUF417 family protein [Chloroflexota bacterium]
MDRTARATTERDTRGRDARYRVAATRLVAVGGGVLRYGLVAILLYFGSFKFTQTEAELLQPMLANSPLLSWLYAVTSVRGAAALLGVAELAMALLLAARPVAPRLAALGSVGAMGMFLTTLSLLATTPGAWAQVPDFPLPIPGPAGAFLIKDLFLLGAATWSAGEALGAAAGTAAGPTPGRDGDEGAPD